MTFALEGGPTARDSESLGHPHQEKPLVCRDMLAVGELDRDLPPGDFRADGFAPQAGLFSQFAHRRLIERFAILDAAARRRPEILAGERPGTCGRSDTAGQPPRVGSR